MKRKDAGPTQLSLTDDQSPFPYNYPSSSQLRVSTHSSSITIRPLQYFKDLTAAVSETGNNLQDTYRDKWKNISLTQVDVLLSRPKPKTRAELLEHSCELRLDPNTAHQQLLLSEGNREATLMEQELYFPRLPHRLIYEGNLPSRRGIRNLIQEYQGDDVLLQVKPRNHMSIKSNCGSVPIKFWDRFMQHSKTHIQM